MTAAFEIRTEPIDSWPLPDTTDRAIPRFKATHGQTMSLLRRELTLLGATGSVVLQVVTRNGATDLRRDGELRSGTKVEHPGCRLSFESRHGALTYSTDAFATYEPASFASWRVNLRAIALSLEALRAVDRYGVSRRGEQYRGWQQLVGSGQAMTKEHARYVLHAASGLAGPVDAYDDAELYREAAKRTHPSSTFVGPRDPTRWPDVQRAVQSLEVD